MTLTALYSDHTSTSHQGRTRLSILDYHIASRDHVEERWLGIAKQDVEVLNGPDALQRLPVLEPHHLRRSVSNTVDADPYILLANLGHERRLDEPSNGRPHLLGQVASGRVLGQGELGPHDQVNDPLGQAVRPVIVEDLDVPRIRKGRAVGRDVGPAETIVEHEVQDGAVGEGDVADELAVAAQLGGRPVEAGEVVGI
jgi:hypothetical protein